MNPRCCLTPDWNAPPAVHALVTTRVDGDPLAVGAKRERLRLGIPSLPSDPLWLRQVHGAQVLAGEDYCEGAEADACIARTPGLVCAVLTADCLPLLLCAEDASVVAAVHAGWRGLSTGVIEACVAAMAVPPAGLLAWLGPAIGPRVYEVGAEVRAVFCAQDAAAEQAFLPRRPGKWLCDLYLLARQRLAALGVERVSGGEYCTFSDPQRFYSYRRDGLTGHMASCIWLDRSDQNLPV